MFRRKPAEETPTGTAAEGLDGGPESKGRPTPSRKEAEAARKARLKPATDKKSAARADRARTREERERARRALMAGDERYLPARDQGPVRRFARDFVDSRRSLGELMLPAVLGFLLLSFVPNNTVRAYAILGFYLFILLVLVDTVVLALRVRKGAAARFPDDDTKVVGYSALRALQVRRLRVPKPKVRPGEKV